MKRLWRLLFRRHQLRANNYTGESRPCYCGGGRIEWHHDDCLEKKEDSECPT